MPLDRSEITAIFTTLVFILPSRFYSIDAWNAFFSTYGLLSNNKKMSIFYSYNSAYYVFQLNRNKKVWDILIRQTKLGTFEMFS